MCSNRTAHMYIANCSNTPTVTLLFEVSHIDHDILKNAALDSIWLEYQSATYYLEGTPPDKEQAVTNINSPEKTSSVVDLLDLDSFESPVGADNDLY